MKLRIIHVLWSATIGGIERIVLDLALAQKKNELLEVSILIARPEGGFYMQFIESGLPVHTLDMKSGSDISAGCYRKAKQLFINNDIIHIHSFNPMIAVAAERSGRKIIYTEHGNFGYGKKFTLRKLLLASLQKKFLNDYADIITFNSRFTLETSLKLYGLKKPIKKVVYNGIPAFARSLPDETISNKVKDAFVVGTVARLAPVKHIERLINSFALFAGEKKTFLLIVGDGPLMNSLQQKAASLAIDHNTIFTGYRADARNYFQLMDVVVIPSHNEAFGIAAVEAMAVGKPVLVMKDGGGLVELVESISPQDVVNGEVALAERIGHYYSHPLSETEKESRKRFAGKFSINKMEEELFEIYQM